MSKETFYEKFTSLNHKIDSMLQNYAVTNWIDSVARIMIFIDDEKNERIIQDYPVTLQPTLREKLQYYKENPEAAYATILHIMNSYDDFTFEEYDELISDMQALSYNDAAEIIDQVSKKKVILAEKIKSKLFTFEDFVKIDDRGIQMILRETDFQILGKALKLSSDEVKNKIYKNMSQRAVSMFKEDMDYMRFVERQEILEAQDEIKKTVLRLIARGDVVLNNMKDEVLI